MQKTSLIEREQISIDNYIIDIIYVPLLDEDTCSILDNDGNQLYSTDRDVSYFISFGDKSYYDEFYDKYLQSDIFFEDDSYVYISQVEDTSIIEILEIFIHPSKRGNGLGSLVLSFLKKFFKDSTEFNELLLVSTPKWKKVDKARLDKFYANNNFDTYQILKNKNIEFNYIL